MPAASTSVRYGAPSPRFAPRRGTRFGAALLSAVGALAAALAQLPDRAPRTRAALGRLVPA